jgi:hypothetical protein
VLVAALCMAAISSGVALPRAAPAPPPEARARGSARIERTSTQVLSARNTTGSAEASALRPGAARNRRTAGCALPVNYLRRIRRGYAPGRSPDILMVPREPNFFGALPAVTSHSGPWNYVQQVPLVFYGPGSIRSQGDLTLAREATLADIAPTIAELVGAPFPQSRPGRAISEALVPEPARRRPALVLTIVWDGGGWNVLNTWPKAWPTLARMARRGTSVSNVVVGSSPSVTPAVHATIGTGAFPKQHGVVDIPLRTPDGVVPYSFPLGSSHLLEMRTLADLYDPTSHNRARIGMFAFQFFHLGMMGHGASLPGGDRDIAVIAEREDGQFVTRSGDFFTNEGSYYLPPYTSSVPGFGEDLRAVDLEDGRLDSRWGGTIDLRDPSHVRHSPVWVRYQTRVIEEVMRKEGFGRDRIPDLFFVNYKEIDDVGHNWNMLGRQTRDTLRASDDMLARLIHWLDQTVGRNRWVIALTADHGQTPLPTEVGAWPIRMNALTYDVARHFGVRAGDLFAEERPAGLWLRRSTMAANGITAEEISSYLLDYRIRDNASGASGIPRQYRKRMGERVFSAVFPGRSLGSIWRCARRATP